MVRKFIVFSFSFLFLVGCSSGVTVKESIKGEMECVVEDSRFTLMLEDGQIVKYIDSVDGELGSEIVDILNDEHLVGVTDNDEAIRIMNASLNDLDGYCVGK